MSSVIRYSGNAARRLPPLLSLARRLSYAIWLLLDGLKVGEGDARSPSHSEVLAMDTIERRLEAARESMEGINSALKRMIRENRKNRDEEK